MFENQTCQQFDQCIKIMMSNYSQHKHLIKQIHTLLMIRCFTIMMDPNMINLYYDAW